MLWAVLAAAVAGLAVWLWLQDKHNPVDVCPGPLRLPIIGSSLSLLKVSPRRFFDLMGEFAREYGDRYVLKIFRRRILHLHAPEDIEVVLSHSKNISKSPPYEFLQPWLGTGLLLSNGQKWHMRRRVLTPTFHFNILKNFAPIVEEKCRGFVERLKTSKDVELNLFPAISDLTLAIICETAMGTQLDQDQSKATVEYKAAILEIGYLLLYRVTRVWLHSDFIFQRTAIGKKFNETLNKVHLFADTVIQERKLLKQQSSVIEDVILDGEVYGIKKRMAMLDLLLEAQSKGEIDLDGIREEVNTFMFEGHDTTATCLTFALMLLADHEEVQEQVQEELCSIFEKSDRVPTTDDLAQMKYIEAVIRETLRMYPSVPFLARLITEDIMLGDMEVKRGTEVAINVYDLQHKPGLWPDPEKFSPDRFLLKECRHPYAFLPFSAGPRNCIGQRFAMQEMKCALSEICRSFKLEPRVKGWRPTLVSDLVLRSLDPIFVKFIRR